MSDKQTEYAAPDPETDDDFAVCPVCGKTRRVSDMCLTVDQTDMNGNDDVLAVRRSYVCSEDCLVKIILDEVSADE